MPRAKSPERLGAEDLLTMLTGTGNGKPRASANLRLFLALPTARKRTILRRLSLAGKFDPATAGLDLSRVLDVVLIAAQVASE